MQATADFIVLPDYFHDKLEAIFSRQHYQNGLHWESYKRREISGLFSFFHHTNMGSFNSNNQLNLISPVTDDPGRSDILPHEFWILAIGFRRSHRLTPFAFLKLIFNSATCL